MDGVRELRILNPWRIDAILRNEMVPSSKSSSIPSLLLTKSMSANDAATVPEMFLKSTKVVDIMY
jgi:hypothetical protein